MKKNILLLLFVFCLVSCNNFKQIQVKSNGVIDVVKCLFNSEVLQNDFWELIDEISTGNGQVLFLSDLNKFSSFN